MYNLTSYDISSHRYAQLVPAQNQLATLGNAENHFSLIKQQIFK